MYRRKLVQSRELCTVKVGYKFSGLGPEQKQEVFLMRGYIPNTVDFESIKRETEYARELMKELT